MNSLIRTFRRLLRGKSPREVLIEQATQAALDRTLHAQASEYHAAMERMLMARIARIERELRNYQNLPETSNEPE